MSFTYDMGTGCGLFFVHTDVVSVDEVGKVLFHSLVFSEDDDDDFEQDDLVSV